MPGLWMLSVVGLCLLALAVGLRRTRLGRRTVSPRAFAGTAAGALVLALAFGAVQLLGLDWFEKWFARPVVVDDSLLAAGERVPPLEAEGWLNGRPPAAGPNAPRLLLVDVWGKW